MRLTLRSMLAYMADILDPQDAEEIGAKIRESQYATKLLHRMHDVMRRLRVGAPGLDEHGKKVFDPNTVAEYLDHVLPADRVPDFEKVCLESDVHLAEVVSCHQILTLVLGEPAEVDPASRQKMYKLPEVAAAREKARAATEERREEKAAEQPPRRAAAGGRAAERRKPEVPDYLRATRRHGSPIWSLAAAVCFLLLAGYILLVVTGNGGVVSEWLGFKPTEGPVVSSLPSGESAELAAESQTVRAGSERGPSGEAAEETGKGAESPSAPSGKEPGTGGASGQSAAAGAGSEAIVGQAKVGPKQEAVASRASAGPAQAAAGRASGAEAARGERPGQPLAGAGGAEAAPEVAEQTTEAEPAGEAGQTAQPEPPPAQPVGQYISEGELCVLFNPEDNTCIQLKTGQRLYSSKQYVALPTYRPKIKIGEAIELELVGPTHIVMLSPEPDGTPAVALQDGRMIISTSQKAGARLRLRVDHRDGVIRFVDAASTVAVERTRLLKPGHDPETEPGPLNIQAYATRGRVIWEDVNDPRGLVLRAPVQWTISSEPIEVTTPKEMPLWIGADVLSPLEREASRAVRAKLETADSVFMTLSELAVDRRREVRELAFRCFAALGDFELLILELDKEERSVSWPKYIELLRAAVARDAAWAAAVREAMEKLHGPEGTRLYEMLWRFDERSLTPELGEELVGYLDHSSLAVRVLAFYQLRRASGNKGFGYDPRESASRRYAAIRRWQEEIHSLTGGAGPEQEPSLPPAVAASAQQQTAGEAEAGEAAAAQPPEEQAPAAPNPPEIQVTAPAAEQGAEGRSGP